MNTLVEPSGLERYMIVWGTYSPIRTDDLRPHWEAMIGRRSLWLVDAPVETGPYAGQWIFHPPHCDLSDIVVPRPRESARHVLR